MNIAITGASGNIGGMVARHLNTRPAAYSAAAQPRQSSRSAELRGAAVCLW